MTPQETALVTTLLQRLKTTGGQLKDPEAAALICQTTAEQADAAYYLAQTVLIQDLSLRAAQHRIAELEKNLAAAKTALAPPPSFLGGLLGGKSTGQPNVAGRPISTSGGGTATTRQRCSSRKRGAAVVRCRIDRRIGWRRFSTPGGNDRGCGRRECADL